MDVVQAVAVDQTTKVAVAADQVILVAVVVVVVVAVANHITDSNPKE